MSSFKTPKGTDLPIMDLRGKDYLEVKYRIVWFREECPAHSIETELVTLTDTAAVARATIKDESGRVLATSHKSETQKGFADFIEKAETGAIGRALALIGFGTQFCADEMDEGGRIVDSPVARTPSHVNAPIAAGPKPVPTNGGADSCPSCKGKMMISLRNPNEYYCRTCKVPRPRVA